MFYKNLSVCSAREKKILNRFPKILVTNILGQHVDAQTSFIAVLKINEKPKNRHLFYYKNGSNDFDTIQRSHFDTALKVTFKMA